MSPPNADRALAAADSRATPAVARPSARWVLPAGLAGVLLLGVVTFAALQRTAPPADNTGLPLAATKLAGSADLPPPPALAPLPIVEVPTAAPLVIAAPMPAIVQAAAAPPAPRNVAAPALIVDLPPADRAAAGDDGSARAASSSDKLSANEAFAVRVGRTAPDSVGTDKMSSTDRVVPQGTVIVAVLETAIDSDLPGLVRAVVSRDVMGFDGTLVLIPRGSRLIGQYSSGIALGQSRAFVIWTRVLRSDGVSVQLGSPLVDPLGTAGVGGSVNTHFLKRFGSAILLSVITSGLDYLVNKNSAAQLIVGSPQQANQLASVALQRQIDIPPTIRIAQGTPVRVFVARDLDFALSNVAATTTPASPRVLPASVSPLPTPAALAPAAQR